MRLEIITRMDRNDALSAVRSAINHSGGWIMDHTLFSNVSASIRFEIPAPSAGRLVEQLIVASLPPVAGGDVPECGPDKSIEELQGNISLTFIHDETDLRRPVPSFG